MTEVTPTEDRTAVPTAYLIVGETYSWLQWTPAVSEADASLVSVQPLYASLAVNDRHHSGSDNERMFENVRDAWKIVWEREAQIAQLSAALQGYIDNCTNEECEYCIKARAALNSTGRQTSDDVGRLLDALASLEMLYARPGENSIDHFERVAEVFFKETGHPRPGKECRLKHTQTPPEAYQKWIDKKIRVARAALKGVPQPGTNDYQADAGAPALSEKVNVRSEWQPIGTAPKDQGIIVAVLNTYSKTWTVGEARWQSDDPDHPDDGDWWWANVSPGDYTGDSIFNMNGPVEYWQPLPSPPGAELNFSNEAERDAVSLKPNTSSQPASEAGKLSTDPDQKAKWDHSNGGGVNT